MYINPYICVLFLVQFMFEVWVCDITGFFCGNICLLNDLLSVLCGELELNQLIKHSRTARNYVCKSFLMTSVITHNEKTPIRMKERRFYPNGISYQFCSL